MESYFSQFGLRETGHEQGEGADVYHVRLCFPDNGHENKIEVLGRYTYFELVQYLATMRWNTDWSASTSQVLLKLSRWLAQWLSVFTSQWLNTINVLT